MKPVSFIRYSGYSSFLYKKRDTDYLLEDKPVEKVLMKKVMSHEDWPHLLLPQSLRACINYITNSTSVICVSVNESE